MKRFCQTTFFLAATLLPGAVGAQDLRLHELPRILITATNPTPSLPQEQSPVTVFRQLLALDPVARVRALASRSPAIRQRILDKVHEYLALDADERELRLQATELHWYLTPLLRLDPAQRDARLSNVPDDMRELIKTRLTQWDILPPPLRQEFLANDHALHYFARLEPTNHPEADARRQQIAGQFDQFFELTPGEKQKALSTLSPDERVQMERTLQAFDQLPPSQRQLCLRNFSKFAGLSPAERAEFLKNAAHWSEMPPKERQAWRDLVAHVPEWPPMPPMPSLAPPLPPGLSPHPVRSLSPAMATNEG